MATYQVGFSVRVTSGDQAESIRLEFPVEASSATNAAAQLGAALQTVIAAEKRVGAKESKAK